MVAVAIVVLVAAAFADRSLRRRALTAALAAVVLAALVPAPWYVHQATRYSNPVFDRPQEDEFCWPPTARVLRRRRLPGCRRRPWQGRFSDRFLPILYAETWGDYFGIWAWGPRAGEPDRRIDSSLARRVPRPPSDLSRARRCGSAPRARGLPRARTSGASSLLYHPSRRCSVLYLAVAYPTSDGDTIKGTLCTRGCACTRPLLRLRDGHASRRSRRRTLAVALVASASRPYFPSGLVSRSVAGTRRVAAMVLIGIGPGVAVLCAQVSGHCRPSLR